MGKIHEWNCGVVVICPQIRGGRLNGCFGRDASSRKARRVTADDYRRRINVLASPSFRSFRTPIPPQVIEGILMTADSVSSERLKQNKT